MSDRSPTPILRSPELVETAVRGTLREALAARHLRNGEIDRRSFGNRAIELLHELAESIPGELDAFAMFELEVAAVNAASILLSSKLGKRLFAIDTRKLKAATPDLDAIVKDDRGTFHFVRFELSTSDAGRAELAKALSAIAEKTAPGKRMKLHVFSLRDARARTYPVKPVPLQATPLHAAPLEASA